MNRRLLKAPKRLAWSQRSLDRSQQPRCPGKGGNGRLPRRESHLVREDELAVYVSMRRAEITGNYMTRSYSKGPTDSYRPSGFPSFHQQLLRHLPPAIQINLWETRYVLDFVRTIDSGGIVQGRYLPSTLEVPRSRRIAAPEETSWDR